MYKKILVVVDDRVVTQSAIRQAIEMAQRLRADIHFLYVLPPPETLGFEFLPMAELADQEFQDKAMAHAQKMLAAASEQAERAGVLSFQSTGCGYNDAQCVSDAAEKMHCDVIVVGTDGKNAVLRILSGSIVPRLISIASVPILVCRDTGSSRGYGRRTSVSIRARHRRQELLERRRKESND
ncbi:MAG: universal stress protein [Rhodoferax sp.]|nr:universal stress protein [Rhodoferax sp.]